MRRFLISALILGLVAGSAGVAQAKNRAPRFERTVEATYQLPFVPFNAWCRTKDGWGCVEVRTGPKERFLTATVSDAHLQPVFVQVMESCGRTVCGDTVTLGRFCGETTKPIRVPAGTELHLWLGSNLWPGSYLPWYDSGYWSCPRGMFTTTGTVRITLSNRP